MHAIFYRIDNEHNLKVVGWVSDELPSGSESCKADVKSKSVHGYVYLFINFSLFIYT